MKRIGELYNKIYNFNNLYEAYLKARKNKRYRLEVMTYTNSLEENLITLQNELIWGKYKIGNPRIFTIFIPKIREIKALPFRDRVLQHALNTVIEPYFERSFYNYSYACRKDKGTHKASLKVQEWLYIAEKNNKNLYCLKCDIKKFFNSVDLKILVEILSRKIKDKKVIWLIKQILGKSQKGMPIGSLTSQLFANIYLNELDKFVKHSLKMKYYIRYMDDFIIFSESKSELHYILNEIENFLKTKLELELNNKTRIQPVKTGVEFVGYIHFFNKIRIRKSSWKRFKKNLKTTKKSYDKNTINKETYNNTISSYYGHLKHTKNKKIINKIVKMKL